MIIQYIFSLSLIYVISFANIKAALINIVILPMDQCMFIVIGATPHLAGFKAIRLLYSVSLALINHIVSRSRQLFPVKILYSTPNTTQS